MKDWTLKGNELVSIPIEIVEEREQVESQFAPALFLTVGQDVSVHDGCRVIQP